MLVFIFIVALAIMIFLIVVTKMNKVQQEKALKEKKRISEEEAQKKKQIQQKKREDAKQRKLDDKKKYIEEIKKQLTEHPEYEKMYFEYVDKCNDIFWQPDGGNDMIKEARVRNWQQMINGAFYDKYWNYTPYKAFVFQKEDYEYILGVLQNYKNFVIDKSNILKSDDIDISIYIDILCKEIYSCLDVSDFNLSFLLYYSLFPDYWSSVSKNKSSVRKPTNIEILKAYEKIFVKGLKNIVAELKEREELHNLYEEEGLTDKLLTFSEKVLLHRAVKYLNECDVHISKEEAEKEAYKWSLLLDRRITDYE